MGREVCLGFCILLSCNALLNVFGRIRGLWERCLWKLEMREYLVHIGFLYQDVKRVRLYVGVNKFFFNF